MNDQVQLVEFDKNDPIVQEILTSCAHDTGKFGRTFFPDEFTKPFSMIHHAIQEKIDGTIKRKKAIAAPRGVGKTTWAKTRICRAIAYREVHFIVYVSKSATFSEMQTEAIKRMMRSNEMIRAIFGDIKVKNEILDDSFSKKSWTAFGDIFILPRGAGQQVRGLNWNGYRPELVIIDDLEDSENVLNEDQRIKLSNWFHADLEKTESRYGRRAEFLYIDTIKHEDAQLQRLINSSEWDSIILSICDADLNSFDENYMTTEEIKKEYEYHLEKGKADLFYMEFMNIPISLKDAVFKTEMFKYFEDSLDHLEIISDLQPDKIDKVRKYDLYTVVIVDPAKTTNLSSAESACVVASVDIKSHKIFFREVVSKKVKPDELYNIMFELCIRYRANALAVEVTSLHEFISQPIQNEMRVRGIFVNYIELIAKGKKEERVKTLAPYYKLGYVYHHRVLCRALELQLQWFPKSRLFDAMDAAAYITKIMDENFLFFDPGEMEDPEDDYTELEDEEPIEDWRLI